MSDNIREMYDILAPEFTANEKKIKTQIMILKME